MQRETRERAEQDREERERGREENIEMEDAIRKEALARDESLREESRKEKEENLARIEKSRFRDTVLAGLSSYREGDDLESYLDTLENSFTKVGLGVVILHWGQAVRQCCKAAGRCVRGRANIPSCQK